jgi:GDPmannose 4,6-dehydratase
MKTALITGVSGQDGRHLAELLIAKNYKVFGMINGQREESSAKLRDELPDLIQVKGDLADTSSLISVVNQTHPDEIYNLGAISFVGLSFTQPELTANITGLGVLRLLEAVRTSGISEKTKIYQASSSEMFGKVTEVPQNENTRFHPRSPYGVAKVFAHNACINYREAYGMFISCGILFNHEGEKRGLEFVTRKITKGVARIVLGLQSEIRLGNLEAKRDWGYAGDYAEAMWQILQQGIADDFVIATGKTHSVKDFLNLTFEFAGINQGLKKHVTLDEKFLRPAEVDLLIGDATKAHRILGWTPKTTFEEMVKRMLINDLQIEATRNNLPVPILPITNKA